MKIIPFDFDMSFLVDSSPSFSSTVSSHYHLPSDAIRRSIIFHIRNLKFKPSSSAFRSQYLNKCGHLDLLKQLQRLVHEVLG